jgi:hypothetical protein
MGYAEPAYQARNRQRYDMGNNPPPFNPIDCSLFRKDTSGAFQANIDKGLLKLYGLG